MVDFVVLQWMIISLKSIQAAVCNLVQLKLWVDLLTLFTDSIFEESLLKIRHFAQFKDPVFEDSLFKIRHFVQLLAGSCFLFIAVYTFKNGFDPSTASNKVELKAGNKFLEHVCKSTLTCSGGPKPRVILL